jgi:anthranilate phosphoribosyltransferase
MQRESGLAVHLRSIARGAAGARALDVDAADEAFGLLLDRHASPLETGAFLVAMRMKGETREELTGFLRAAQARCVTLSSDAPVAVLPSYNGARRLPNLTPLLALALARDGHRVLIHGTSEEPGRIATAAVLRDLGLPAARDEADVQAAWSQRKPAFLPVERLCAPLAALLEHRRVLGLRGPGHSVAKMLNPVRGAPALRVVNHTHPEFGALMDAWARHERIDALLLRGTEGEPVADPRRLPRLDVVIGGVPRPELGAAAQDGVLAELPLLPRCADSAATALLVQELLSGQRPLPAPLARQIAVIGQALAELATREAGPAGPPAPWADVLEVSGMAEMAGVADRRRAWR